MKRMTWLLIVLTLISCLLLIAPVSAGPAATTNLTGTVVDQFTGLPIPGVEIDTKEGTAYSLADGSFSLPNTIVGFDDGQYFVKLDFQDENCYDEYRTTVNVTEAEVYHSKDLGTIKLTPGVAGYVYNSVTHQPVSDVQLTLTDPSSGDFLISSTTSKNTGYYIFPLNLNEQGLNHFNGSTISYGYIPPNYTLTAVKNGYQSYSNSEIRITYKGSDDGVPHNIQLVPIFTAGFYAFGHVGQAPYSVRFLDQTVGSPTAWKWDFGDGTTSTEQNPTHIYNQTGAYNVVLTASNDETSDTCTQYRCVIVNTVPTANFTANVTSGPTPLTAQFTDESSTASGYQWQFGDGATSTDQNPVHTYTQPGSYTVTLVISSADYGSVYTQKTGYITVSDPPMVGFTANVTAGLAPLGVQFNESINGSVQYYYWQFGDGGTSFDQNPVHRYDTAGRYTVSLYAIGSNGTQVKTVDDYINVTAPVTPTPTVTVTSTVTPAPTATGYPPVANFTVTPQGGAGSMGILVTDTSVNATSVRYDLGDGTTTAYRNFQFTYWQAGTYTIKQTATNAAGSSNKTISVTVPTVPVTTTPTSEGGDQGWYTIHCNVDGATVLFDQTTKGTIAQGILKIQVYTTGTPYRTYTVQKDGYTTVSGTITDHPGKDQNVDITVNLTPTGQAYNGPHNLPGTLQAEDYDLGGEGVAYHDTTPGNEGGVYRHDDVDIEQLDTDGSPNVGWIRAGEWLAYTVNVSTAGTYDAGFRVASSHAGSTVQVYVDGGTTPVATVTVPNTGDWPVFQTVSAQVTLPAGQHRLRLVFPTDYVNINWITFALRG
ncbi:PKD domain-containing protein [Methanosphaerula palustris]|nr:PKD domain-containing protein [Methanosphaerula palustris]